MKNNELETNDTQALCSCCGLTVVELWDICEICHWQSDKLQNSNPDYSGGANRESLNEYQSKWHKKDRHPA